jgi:hypothetical protein
MWLIVRRHALHIHFAESRDGGREVSVPVKGALKTLRSG